MTDREDIVAAVLAAADGELVGRIRLQKAVYLLDQLGFCSGFDYAYYHYGPYSRELDNAMLDAKALSLVREDVRHRAGDGAPFSVFTLPDRKAPDPKIFGTMGVDTAKALLRKFKETNVTILELAATAHWIAVHERLSDWEAEVRKRKNVKSQNGRLERALKLLEQLDLPPAVAYSAST